MIDRARTRASSQGFRTEGCRECPRGRYGSTEGLTTALCTSACPVGRYRDKPGATSQEDCLLCPPGVYGNSRGLKTKQCTASCPDGTYSNVWELTDQQDCIDCPTGYRGWQCKWPVTAQHFNGDRDHAYQTDVFPATKLRSSPVRFAKGSNADRPSALTIPYSLPLSNEITTGNSAGNRRP